MKNKKNILLAFCCLAYAPTDSDGIVQIKHDEHLLQVKNIQKDLSKEYRSLGFKDTVVFEEFVRQELSKEYRSLGFKDTVVFEEFVRQEELFEMHVMIKIIEMYGNEVCNLFSSSISESKMRSIGGAAENIWLHIRALTSLLNDHFTHNLKIDSMDAFLQILKRQEGKTNYINSKKKLFGALQNLIKGPNMKGRARNKKILDGLKEMDLRGLTEHDRAIHKLILNTFTLVTEILQKTEAAPTPNGANFQTISECFEMVRNKLPEIVEDLKAVLAEYCHSERVPEKQREWGKKVLSSLQVNNSKQSKSKLLLYLGIAGIVTVCVVGIGACLYFSNKKQKTSLV